MPQRERTELMLAKARHDIAAMSVMLDAGQVPEDIFGFHAQQATEKALKAWLLLVDTDPPLTHNLVLLATLLTDAGVDISLWDNLVEYSPYAVIYRYEEVIETDEPLDRKAALEAILSLVEHVQQLAAEA